MDIFLDNPEIDKQFQEILLTIKNRKNGVVSDSMKQQGISYKLNWGVSIIELKQIAKGYEQNHLLALKLWNKQWRETMILATLLDEPKTVAEEQMDFWTKSFENIEIVEQATANLWVKTPFAFVKAIEWCRGKKHFVRYTGVQLIGRLALTEKTALDEMFEPFYEFLTTLSKDKNLGNVIYRSLLILGSRSEYLNNLSVQFSNELMNSESVNAKKLGKMVNDELTSDYIRDVLKSKKA